MNSINARTIRLVQEACRNQSAPSPSAPGSGSNIPAVLRTHLEQIAEDNHFSHTQVFLWAEEELARGEK